MSFSLSSRALTYNCYGVRASGLQYTFDSFGRPTTALGEPVVLVSGLEPAALGSSCRNPLIDSFSSISSHPLSDVMAS